MALYIYLLNTSVVPFIKVLLLKVSEVARDRFAEVFTLLVEIAASIISGLLCVSPKGVLLVEIVESAASTINSLLCSLF
jgi:hypothetical protein